MEIDKEIIKKEAKEIMDNFLKELKNIELEKDYTNFREDCYREETSNFISEDNTEKEQFRILFFRNAPRKSDNFILSKKGDWIK